MIDKLSCKYCNTDYYSHRLLSHIIKEHKEAFLMDKDHSTTLTTFYKRKEGISKAIIQKGADMVWCCFGCMTAFSREHYKNLHLSKHHSCKDKHIQFEEDNKATFYKDTHGRTIADTQRPPSDCDDEVNQLLEKLKALEKENARLNTRVDFLTKRVTNLQDEKAQFCTDLEAFQEIVDKKLPEQQKKLFKRLLSKKSPETFERVYSHEDKDEDEDEDEDEDNSEDEDKESIVSSKDPPLRVLSTHRPKDPPLRVLSTHRPKDPPLSVPSKTLYTGIPQSQYKPYFHNEEVFFIDRNCILYDKNHKNEYIRCGIVNRNGKIEWD